MLHENYIIKDCNKVTKIVIFAFSMVKIKIGSSAKGTLTVRHWNSLPKNVHFVINTGIVQVGFFEIVSNSS